MKDLENLITLIKTTINATEHVDGWSYFLPIRCKQLSMSMRELADKLDRYAGNCGKERYSYEPDKDRRASDERP